MQAVGADHPARALRARVASLRLPGMLRWDASGEALLLSDAPRRMPAAAAMRAMAAIPARIAHQDGLLRIDLLPQAYAALLSVDFAMPGPWDAAWFEAQALLAGILARPAHMGHEADVPLLRAALLASAQDAAQVRAFLRRLRAADAVALRRRQTASTRASAAYCASWLWQAAHVGLPAIAAWRGAAAPAMP